MSVSLATDGTQKFVAFWKRVRQSGIIVQTREGIACTAVMYLESEVEATQI
jgi:hypothetical protein